MSYMATLTSKGQIVIPAAVRERYGLTAGTQVEFVDDGDGISLRIRRKVAASNPEQGFGMIQLPSKPGRRRSLADFDAADYGHEGKS